MILRAALPHWRNPGQTVNHFAVKSVKVSFPIEEGLEGFAVQFEFVEHATACRMSAFGEYGRMLYNQYMRDIIGSQVITAKLPDEIIEQIRGMNGNHAYIDERTA